MELHGMEWTHDLEHRQHFAVLPNGRVIAEIELDLCLAPRMMGTEWLEQAIWFVTAPVNNGAVKVYGLAKAKALAEGFLASR